ncbi:MAG: hypothetical protein CRN43_19860, partial [Candidatus Nephrothrix sp. EaCA]
RGKSFGLWGKRTEPMPWWWLVVYPLMPFSLNNPVRVTEAYQGALISQKKGASSPVANQFERIYGTSGKEMQMNPDGSYPTGVRSADWYVTDKKGNKVVIQELK